MSVWLRGCVGVWPDGDVSTPVVSPKSSRQLWHTSSVRPVCNRQHGCHRGVWPWQSPCSAADVRQCRCWRPTNVQWRSAVSMRRGGRCRRRWYQAGGRRRVVQRHTWQWASSCSQTLHYLGRMPPRVRGRARMRSCGIRFGKEILIWFSSLAESMVFYQFDFIQQSFTNKLECIQYNYTEHRIQADITQIKRDKASVIWALQK